MQTPDEILCQYLKSAPSNYLLNQYRALENYGTRTRKNEMLMQVIYSELDRRICSINFEVFEYLINSGSSATFFGM